MECGMPWPLAVLIVAASVFIAGAGIYAWRISQTWKGAPDA